VGPKTGVAAVAKGKKSLSLPEMEPIATLATAKRLKLGGGQAYDQSSRLWLYT
jgi:hypothetical protein